MKQPSFVQNSLIKMGTRQGTACLPSLTDKQPAQSPSMQKHLHTRGLFNRDQAP